MTTATAEPAAVTYSTMRLVELTGATYRQIDHWCRCGFTAAELDLIYTVLGLLRFGVMPSKAFDLARRLLADEQITAQIADIFTLSISVTRREVSE